uniref:Zgc:123295 n=1 Tax=Cyprinus carpio TaxID=7962 RepID=A0A8C2AUX9_CYPCA
MDVTTIKLSFHISCGYYIILILTLSFLSSVCGQAPLNNKIVGGEAATAGAWPWQVSLHITCDGGLCYCGGSLINKDWVLSAAHSSSRTIQIYLGRQSQSESNPNEVLRTASATIHPNYNSLTHDNDIALLHLSSSVTFTDYIKPVCLAAAGSKFAAGTDSWVTGWGALQSGGPFPDILQEVMIPVVSSRDCYNAYGGGITSNMICAGFCSLVLVVVGQRGDSGGPLVTRNGSLWIQSGVVSFGDGCADRRYPGVYTRVSQYQGWITYTIGSNPPGFVKFNNSGSRSSSNLLLILISLTFSIIPFICSLYLSS